MPEAVIIEAVRTPMGSYRGALARSRPDDLAAHVVSAAVERSGIDPERVVDVFMGAANQAGEDNRDVARMAAESGDQVVRYLSEFFAKQGWIRPDQVRQARMAY